MRVFTYSEARKRLAEVLDLAETTEVVIRRRSGEAFSLKKLEQTASPFSIDGLRLDISTAELVAAVRESRERRH
jgi:PHD/YefM family antitoxin component YafN of YafNO toxin-antitoxin module